MNLYLDIETLPTDRKDVREFIAANIKPPAQYKKPDSIAKWMQEQAPEAIDEAVSKTGLDGAFGRVCCIGWTWGDNIVSTTFGDNESAVISEFVASIEEYQMRRVHEGWPVIVGHNVINFDLRFLWQRAMVNGVKLPSWFPRDPKPWDDTVFDTMLRFAGQRNTIGLDRLCLALGIPGKGDIDGSMVADLWAKDPQAVSDYCKEDVERTRAVYKKMAFAFGEAA